jgi:hypothetical protein
MPEKPAPKPDDDTYSHEETVRRREATVRAMIAMKPKPRSARRFTISVPLKKDHKEDKK